MNRARRRRWSASSRSKPHLGAKPDVFGGTLNSDVVTFVKRDSVNVPTIFNDLGECRCRWR
jgi:hypothetical protein